MKKSITERLNELRNEQVSQNIEDNIQEGLIDAKDIVVEEPEGYTFDELKAELSSENTLDNIIEDWKVTPSMFTSNVVMYSYVSEEASKPMKMEPGHYIGISESKVSEDSRFSHIKGTMSKRVYNQMKSMVPIIHIKGTHDYPQSEFLKDIARGKSFDEVEGAEFLVISAMHESQYLVVADSKYFSKLIEEGLERYNDIQDAENYLKHLCEMRALTEEVGRIIYCPLLNEFVAEIPVSDVEGLDE